MRQDVPRARTIASCSECDRPVKFENPFREGEILEDGNAKDGVCGVCRGKVKANAFQDAPEHFKKMPKIKAEDTFAHREAKRLKEEKIAKEKSQRESVAANNKGDN